MGFWHWVDKIVGYVPVVGTIKDGVEAVVLECEGKHGAALEKALETAVDLAGDIVTVASLGEACEVAVAGKAAAEAALKDAMEAGLKSAAKEQMVQAAREGYTKEAATMMAIAGAAQEAKLAAKKGIAGRAGKEGSKHDTKRKKPEKEPLRGHHVINNDVRRVFPKIIDAFLEHNANYFDGQSFDQLVEQGCIEPGMRVYRSYKHPFNEADDEFIQETVVFTPGKEVHRDANAVEYGTLIASLRVGVSHYMTSLFHMRVRQMPMPRPEQEVAAAISYLSYEMNTNQVYVDRTALNWWIDSGGNEARFIEVRDVVANNFRDLTEGAEFILAWVHDLFEIYEKIRNIPQ